MWGTSISWAHYDRDLRSLDLSRPNPLRNGYYVDGGDFYSRRWSLKSETTHQNWEMYEPGTGRLAAKATPTFNPEGIRDYLPSLPELTDAQIKSDLDALATQYYASGRARTNPLAPKGNTAQALIELVKDPLSLVGKQFIDWKSGVSNKSLGHVLGGEWLNFQFGVAPTVEDFVKAVNVLLDIDRLVAKLKAEAARPVRRKAVLKDETTMTSTQNTGIGYGALGHWGGVGAGDFLPGENTLVKTTITREKVWFVGKYMYFLPTGPMSDVRIKSMVAGINPTLHVLWAVTPWTWLAGWFSNVNDVVKNISSNMTDNLVCRYSYLMQETETRIIWTEHSSYLKWKGNNGSPGYFSGTDKGSASASCILTSTTKRRVGGRNPFGLYVGLPQLTAWQTSILAALGLTRTGLRNH